MVVAPNFVWKQQLNPFIANLGLEEAKVFNAKKFIRNELDFVKMIDNFNDAQRTKLVALLLEYYDIQVIKSENGFTLASQNPEKGVALLVQITNLKQEEPSMKVVDHQEEENLILKEKVNETVNNFL
jgi:hypothetical protein